MKRFLSQGRISKMKGFTLIELIFTVGIMAVVLTLAAPSFLNTIRDNRVLVFANELSAAVGNARSEAVKRGRMVSVCPSANGTACSTNWSDGWMVYVEKDTVTTGASPDVDTVIGIGKPSSATVAARTNGANDWIRFSSRGIAEEATTLQIKPSSCGTGKYFQELVINLVGRISFTKKTC